MTESYQLCVERAPSPLFAYPLFVGALEEKVALGVLRGVLSLRLLVQLGIKGSYPLLSVGSLLPQSCVVPGVPSLPRPVLTPGVPGLHLTAGLTFMGSFLSVV